MKKFLAGAAVAGSILAGSLALTAVNPLSMAGAATTQVQGSGATQSMGHRHIAREIVKNLADKFGMTPKDLVTELKSGKTIAQVAGEHGVDPAQLESDAVAKIDARVDQAVANGRITAERGQTIKDNAPAKVDELVNKVWGQGK